MPLLVLCATAGPDAALLLAQDPLREAPSPQLSSDQRLELTSIADWTTLQERVQTLAQRSLPATVGLQIGSTQGSGVIISREGLVATAAHVAEAPGLRAIIRFHDGQRAEGVTLGVFRTADVALVRISSPPADSPATASSASGKGDDQPQAGWPFLELARDEGPLVGTWCLALGHPGGYQADRPAVLRLGRVRRRLSDLITTDCTLIGGDSGGPLIDLEGRVVGVHSRIGRSLDSNVHIASAVFLRNWKRLEAGESWGRLPGSPFIGVKGRDHPRGAEVTYVYSGGPAEQAGVVPGDVIVQLASQTIQNFESLVQAVANHRRGQQIPLIVERGGRRLELKLIVGEIAIHGIPTHRIAAPRQIAGPPPQGPRLKPPQTRTPDHAQHQRWVRRDDTHSASQRVKFQHWEPTVAPLLVRAGQWTVEIHGPEGRVALGTIVSHDGLIATKASVLQAPVTCRLPDDRLLPARVLATSRRDDLALLRIPAERLVPADWSAQPPAVGTVVLTGGVARRLRAVGIVGVGTREVLGGVLGVALLESNAPGVHLQAVLPGSGAARAGLQPGQQITHLGKQRIVSVDQLVALLRPLLPGDTVQLTLLDGSGRSRSTEVTLGRMSGLGPTEPHQDMSGPLSDRRSGFPAVFQHDSVLLPVDCGGPLIDLQGHVIGVNIARAGREASYAVPAQRVRQWVADQLSNLASADDQQAPPPGHPEPTPPAPQLPVARPTEPAR